MEVVRIFLFFLIVWQAKGQSDCYYESVSEGVGGLQKVREVRRRYQVLHVRPHQGFRRMAFNPVEKYVMSLGGRQMSPATVAFSVREVEAAKVEGDWAEVRVEYFKKEVPMGKDRHALKVTVGNATRWVSSQWWRTHGFEGFVVSAEGPADFSFGCVPSASPSPSPLRLHHTPWLLGVGLALLLVVLPWGIYVWRRHTNAQKPPPVPPLPQSFQQMQNDSGDHLYEELDETLLQRLRRDFPPSHDIKMKDCSGSIDCKAQSAANGISVEDCADLKANGSKNPCQTQDCSKPKDPTAIWFHNSEVRAVSNVYDQLGAPRPVQPTEQKKKSSVGKSQDEDNQEEEHNEYENVATLREARETARRQAGRTSDSLYIEMHGIVE